MPRPRFQRKIITWLLDHAILVVAFVCIVTLAMGYQLRNPSVLSQNYDSEQKEGAEGEELKKFARMFGEGELLMVVVRAPDVFAHDVLAYLQTQTKAIAEFPRVLRVDSLATAQNVTAVDGELATQLLFLEIPTDREALKAKKQTALSNPLWVGNLISPDTTVTVLNVFLPPLMRGSSEAGDIIASIKDQVAIGKPADVDVFLTGLSPMFVDSKACANGDFKRFFILTWVLMAALLFVAFKTLRGVLLPLSVTFLAVFWTLGLMAVTRQTISAVGAMLPTLIGVVCFSDAVHVLAHYYEQAKDATCKRTVVLATMEHMLSACFLTSVTTAAAFGSLVVAKLSSIRQFGLWAAIGIMLGYFLIVVLMPIILSWLPLPGTRVQRSYEGSACGRILSRIAKVAHDGRRWVPLVAVILVLLSLVAASRLRVETSLTAFLPESSPSMQGLAIVQEKLTGFGSVEVVLEGPKGCFEEPWALRELREVEMHIEAREDVGVVLSIMDLLQWTHGIVEASDSDLLSDPLARGLVAEYLFLFSGSGRSDRVGSLVTEDYSTAKIGARLRNAGAGEQVALAGEIKAFADQSLDARLTCRVTGESDRIAQQIRLVIRSLTDSFGFTLLVIVLLMLWLLRSVKAAMLAMIPNILPVVLTLGVMGAMGITLNFATVMITSIAIGIAVDDTIHFLVRYRRELRDNNDIKQAIANTLKHSGRAMTFTTAAMAAGCCLFMLSDFAPSRDFGFLMAFTMITALLSDLFLLPYLIQRWTVRLASEGGA